MVGDVNVQAGGTLDGTGMVGGTVNNNGGTLAPGSSAGELTINGDYTQSASAALEIEIGGLTAGSEYDFLNIAGAATLDGTLDVLLIDSFTPTAGDMFEIITATSILGTFAAETLPALAGGLEWFVNYSDTSVELISTFAGDFDFDGTVDGFDFLSWQRGGSADPLSQSDLADWECWSISIKRLAGNSR